MGNTISLNDRNSAQIALENELGHQIIKLKAIEESPPIQILDIGTFEHGEFVRISQLNAKSYIDVDSVSINRNETLRETNCVYEKTKHDSSFKIHVKGSINEECNLIELEKNMNNSNIDKTFLKKHGFKSNAVYVVQKVYKSHCFLINGDAVVSSNEKSPKLWGYNLAKFKVNKDGGFKLLECRVF